MVRHLFYHGKIHDSLIPDILFGPSKTVTQEYIPVAQSAVHMCLNYRQVIFIKHKTEDHSIIK